MATRRREKHTKELICNKEVAFYTVYIGSITVDRSMRTLPYEMRTAVTKEAIVKVCTAAQCMKQDMKRPKGIKQINKILTQPPDVNRIGVNFTVSLAGLKAQRSDNGKILMNHSMSSISFASCGETPFKSFVGYVAKDPARGRSCHVFNCFGDAHDVVSTVGEAFSIKYEDVLSKHSQCNSGSFEFIEVNTGFFQSIFEESENTAQNNQLSAANKIGGRRKAQSEVMESSDRSEDVPPHSPDSNLSPTRTAPQTLPAPHSAPLKTAPVKPPRPKIPIYANIDEVERQTHGAASDSGSSGVNPEESVRATPEELRKNLEALECSLDEISSEKNSQQKPVNPYSKMSWFHGKICREEAERRLKYQGDYLVRSHGNGQFVLSCMDSGHVRHLLLVDPHGQIRTRDRKFVSITDLVTHYATSGECIVSEGCALRIVRPVPQLQPS
ncbi:SHC-transforming protein 1-like isoform X2 [Bolinopsis microptera]|uniref:SHC-transforming protein 1-like isoform X2 n=1 Tax=Bolinopsis microptera TaxID=2820187 RepID=UPI003079DB8A